MSIIYIGIQGSYKSFEMALFEAPSASKHVVGGVSAPKCLQVVESGESSASSHFLLLLDKLLKENKKTVRDLAFLAVDQGPGAFTSLRVIISLVNGLAFAGGACLIGVDGLDSLAFETHEKLFEKSKKSCEKTILISLLNAYNSEVYYGVFERSSHLKLAQPKGYKKVDIFLDELLKTYTNHKFIFTGNGAELYKDLILEKFGSRASRENLSTSSAKYIAQVGLQAHLCGSKHSSCEHDSVTTQSSCELKPLYLKTQAFSIK